jgi:hypothetical protein
MLSGIVMELVSEEPDLAIVAEVGEADVAVTELEGGAVGDLLRDRPRLRVIALSADGREASSFELRPDETKLGEVSPAALLAAIRGGPQ